MDAVKAVRGALERAAATDLVPVGRPVLVACSGGRDSMALVRALLEDGRFDLHVATVDHGLRPGSADDVEFVVETLAGWGLVVEALRADPGRVRAGHGPEDAARRERYRLLVACAERRSCDRLVTAHTADDQAETLVMRLAEGAGVRGLGGIPERRGIVARPWLCVTRAEVAAYAAVLSVPWREDPTNERQDLRRNRVRRHVLPAASVALGAGWVRPAARAAAQVQADREALDFLVTAWAARTIGREAESSVVDLAAWKGAPAGLRRRLLRDLWVGAAERIGLSVRGAGLHVDRLEALVAGRARRVDLPGGLSATVQRGRLRLGPMPGAVTAAPAALAVPGPGLHEWGAWRLEVVESEHFSTDGTTWFDATAAPFPWIVRAPRLGERYRPLGAPGSKRISRLWIDARVPRAQRPALPALEAAGRLVWVAPLRVAESARAREGFPVRGVRFAPVGSNPARAGTE